MKVVKDSHKLRCVCPFYKASVNHSLSVNTWKKVCVVGFLTLGFCRY